MSERTRASEQFGAKVRSIFGTKVPADKKYAKKNEGHHSLKICSRSLSNILLTFNQITKITIKTQKRFFRTRQVRVVNIRPFHDFFGREGCTLYISYTFSCSFKMNFHYSKSFVSNDAERVDAEFPNN